VAGIDLDGAKITQALTLFAHDNIEYIQGDALRDLPSGHYDVAVLSNVLEHIDERIPFLRQAAETATPQRWLIRVSLFERDWRVPLKKELGCEWRLDFSHYTEYTLEQFQDEMRAAGLVIVHQEIHWGEIWCELRAA
jgi:2-polyprenyl-3-methyl-5-hydroxy-6-metoxy-1,4-benzoquinol methylase